MTQNETRSSHRVTYVGPARGMSFFDAMLREEATDVDYVSP